MSKFIMRQLNSAADVMDEMDVGIVTNCVGISWILFVILAIGAVTIKVMS